MMISIVRDEMIRKVQVMSEGQILKSWKVKLKERMQNEVQMMNEKVEDNPIIDI